MFLFGGSRSNTIAFCFKKKQSPMLISNKTTIIMNNRQLPCHNVLPSRFLKLSSRYRLTWAIKYNFFVSFSFHSDQYSCVGHLFLLSCFFQQGYVGIFGLCKQYYIFRSARTSYEYQQKFLLLQFNLFFSPSVQREWVLDNREVQVKKHRKNCETDLTPGLRNLAEIVKLAKIVKFVWFITMN